MNLNKVIIAGRLSRDPEQKALPSGTAVTSFAVVTNSYFQKDGQRQEEAEFHNIVVFGKQAESCGQYLKKGQLVMIEGRNKTRSWEKDGEKKYRTEIIADRIQFGPRSEGSEKSAPKVDRQAQTPDEPSIQYPTEEINPEDIPF